MLGKRAACIQGERGNRRKRPLCLRCVNPFWECACGIDLINIKQLNLGKAKSVTRIPLIAWVLQHPTAFQGADLVAIRHWAVWPMVGVLRVGGVGIPCVPDPPESLVHGLQERAEGAGLCPDSWWVNHIGSLNSLFLLRCSNSELVAVWGH